MRPAELQRPGRADGPPAGPSVPQNVPKCPPAPWCRTDGPGARLAGVSAVSRPPTRAGGPGSVGLPASIHRASAARTFGHPRRAGGRVEPPPRAGAHPGPSSPASRLWRSVSRPRASASRDRARPSAVRGPVDSPPCTRHRAASTGCPSSPRDHTTRARHGRPSRHRAPHSGRDRRCARTASALRAASMRATW